MKKLLYILGLGAMAVGTGCSRIDANTSNNVPTTDAYAASVTSNTGTGPGVTRADAVVQTGSAGSMMYGARSITEATFLLEAYSSSMMELQMAKLALERSAHPEVKTYAQMLIDHHTKANQELTALASGMNVTLAPALMPDHQKVADKLSVLTGREFDKKYVDEMEQAHERDISLYEVISNGAPTTSIRAFAIRSLPVLRTHEHQADQLEDKVDQ